MFATLRPLARKTVGFLLVVLAVALCVPSLRTLPQGSSAFLAGYFCSTVVLPLALGYIGVKLMLRDDPPANATAASTEP